MSKVKVVAYLTNNGDPIVESAICSNCEGDAGYRIKSWMNARKNSDYEGGSRKPANGLRCVFCKRKG